MNAPMLHAANSEEAVEVVNVHLRVFGDKTVDRLIIVHGIARTDELVGPPDVVDEFPIM